MHTLIKFLLRRAYLSLHEVLPAISPDRLACYGPATAAAGAAATNRSSGASKHTVLSAASRGGVGVLPRVVPEPSVWFSPNFIEAFPSRGSFGARGRLIV